MSALVVELKPEQQAKVKLPPALALSAAVEIWLRAVPPGGKYETRLASRLAA